MNSLRRFLSVAVPILALVVPATMAQPAKCPSPAPNPPPVTISSQLPQDVCLPEDDSIRGITFFDDFSWRSFVALVWPALPGGNGRGKPDPGAGPGNPNRVPVFQTYKADWEVFQPNGGQPSVWSSYDNGSTPCGGSAGGTGIPRDGFELAAFWKFGNVLLATQGGFEGGPLVSQNKQYTRYLAAFNEVAFDNIRNKRWYLQSALHDVTFKPDGQGNNPIAIKSSWVVMTKDMTSSRFYTTRAYVRNTATGTCTVETVGLVGLHIVTKTPTRPQWIWSTFEQIDNVPQPGAMKPYTYNNGNDKEPMPGKNPIGKKATDVPCEPPTKEPPPKPCPFNVTRIQPNNPSTNAPPERYQPINASTIKTNEKYQKALGGVWQYYQLVMTQWPTPGSSTKNGLPSNTIPGSKTEPMTAFANVTMETFDQVRISTGCMACHNAAASSEDKLTDFIWALPLNAWPSNLGTASVPDAHAKLMAKPPSAAVKKLLEILAQGEKDMAASPQTAKMPARKSAKPKTKK